jgi:hypothetical protein
MAGSVAGVIGGLGKSIVRDSGLITWYDYAYGSYPGSGTSLTDLSGNANTGTLQGTPTFNTTNGGTFTLNGTSQYISTTTSYANPPANTICIWFNTTSVAGHKVVGLENTITGTAATAYDRQIYVGTNGLAYGGVYDTAIHTAISNAAVNNGAWQHSVLTYSGTLAILYINGVAQTTTATTTSTQNFTGYYRIGSYKLTSWTNGVDGYFAGTIGPFQLYNRVLTAAEVSQNFNAERGRFGI